MEVDRRFCWGAAALAGGLFGLSLAFGGWRLASAAVLLPFGLAAIPMLAALALDVEGGRADRAISGWLPLRGRWLRYLIAGIIVVCGYSALFTFTFT